MNRKSLLFNFNEGDTETLNDLAEALGVSATEAVRQAIRQAAGHSTIYAEVTQGRQLVESQADGNGAPITAEQVAGKSLVIIGGMMLAEHMPIAAAAANVRFKTPGGVTGPYIISK